MRVQAAGRLCFSLPNQASENGRYGLLAQAWLPTQQRYLAISQDRPVFFQELSFPFLPVSFIACLLFSKDKTQKSYWLQNYEIFFMNVKNLVVVLVCFGVFVVAGFLFLFFSTLEKKIFLKSPSGLCTFIHQFHNMAFTLFSFPLQAALELSD